MCAAAGAPVRPPAGSYTARTGTRAGPPPCSTRHIVCLAQGSCHGGISSTGAHLPSCSCRPCFAGNRLLVYPAGYSQEHLCVRDWLSPRSKGALALCTATAFACSLGLATPFPPFLRLSRGCRPPGSRSDQAKPIWRYSKSMTAHPGSCGLNSTLGCGYADCLPLSRNVPHTSRIA